jgi:hypothetical protein
MTSPLTAILAQSELRRPIIGPNIAAAGSNAETATQLKVTWAKITSVPKGGGVRLLPAIAGLTMVVVRADPSNNFPLAIYPAAGDTIQGGSVIATSGSIQFFCFAHGAWDIVGSSDGLYHIDLLAGLGALSAAMVQRQLGAVTLAGGGAAHG